MLYQGLSVQPIEDGGRGVKAAFRKGPHEGKRPQASEKLSPASNLMHELGSKFFSPVESYDDSSSGHSLTAAL